MLDLQVAPAARVFVYPLSLWPRPDDQNDTLGLRFRDLVEDVGQDRLSRDLEKRFRGPVRERLEPRPGAGHRDHRDRPQRPRAFFSD